MKTMEQSWGRFLPRALVLGAIIAASVFVAVRAAIAREGEPGGHTRTALTVAGSLTVPAGATPSLTFRFYRGAAMATAPLACGPVVVSGAGVRYVEATHTFSAEVPIESCPALFNGESVWVTTEVTNGPGGAVLLPETARSAVNPVPYARYADQYGTPDCPVGYEPHFDGSWPRDSERRLCTKALTRSSLGDADYVVRVGSGSSAFWIDLYEATVASLPQAMGPQRGADGDDFPTTFPDNGQRADGLGAFSLSAPAGRKPTRFVTWFQASAACRNTGKRLPTGEEWLAAAQGTPDPSSGNNGLAEGNVLCNTMSAGPRNPEGAVGCASRWGAQDMIGNLMEWTAEWSFPIRSNSEYFAGIGRLVDGGVQLGGATAAPRGTWGGLSSDYGGDGTFHIDTAVQTEPGRGFDDNLPAAAHRGGAWDIGARAGIFALDLTHAPTYWAPNVGFRCVIPR